MLSEGGREAQEQRLRRRGAVWRFARLLTRAWCVASSVRLFAGVRAAYVA